MDGPSGSRRIERVTGVRTARAVPTPWLALKEGMETQQAMGQQTWEPELYRRDRRSVLPPIGTAFCN